VLQTWTRDLRFHPHVHYLVPAIGLAADGTVCRPRHPAFLVAVKPLAIVFRAKLRTALHQTELYGQGAPDTWRQAWVVDCRLVGSGTAALKYLAPYIFRVALSNKRIVGMQDDRVTFRYRDGKTKQIRSCTVPVLTFIGRFLQNVLPKGFVKVRSYGWFSRRQRLLLAQLRQQLALAASSKETAVVRQPSTPGAAALVITVRSVASRCSQACCVPSVAVDHQRPGALGKQTPWSIGPQSVECGRSTACAAAEEAAHTAQGWRAVPTESASLSSRHRHQGKMVS